jgi:transposase InsO family protein
MVRDLVLEWVEMRFGMSCAPLRGECLTNYGSCFFAKKTAEFASWLGPVSRFIPVRNPESNGKAEAFVNTFKRDYVRLHERPDPATVLAQLPNWFGDSNERHPHKGLWMKSPREFIRSPATAGYPI